MNRNLLKGLIVGFIVGLLLPVRISFDLSFSPKNDLTGIWQDEVSQRANLTIYDQGDNFYIKASWGQSATEKTVWEMTADFDTKSKTFTYKDCECTRLGRDMETDKPIYEEVYYSGTGKIILVGQ